MRTRSFIEMEYETELSVDYPCHWRWETYVSPTLAVVEEGSKLKPLWPTWMSTAAAEAEAARAMTGKRE